MDNEHDGDSETYILLLLSDSNLPTGSFVASSGLESYVTHGFLPTTLAPPSTIAFIQDSLATYARSALPFASDAHRVIAAGAPSTKTLGELEALDALYDAMTLNHVARRASQAQGVALLTLYTKGFSPPAHLPGSGAPAGIAGLVDQLKLAVRRGETPGHLPVCWGVLTGALRLTLGAAPPSCCAGLQN